MPTASAISRTVVAATPLRANSPAATVRICSCLSTGSRLMSGLSIVRPEISNKRLLRWPEARPMSWPAEQLEGRPMRQKLMTPAAAVAELRSGMTIGIGGWGSRRKPMTLVRAICRSDLTDLTIVSYGGPDVGLLCAAGRVRKLVYGFVSLDSIPLEPHFRLARQRGTIPELVELDEGMLQWGLYAASLRLPFLPTRAGLGSDVMRINPQLKLVKSPYDDGEELVAM